MVLIICILCIPMFSVMIPRAKAQSGSGSVEAGVYNNPVPPGYGFINFEEGTDGQVIRSTLPGLRFTTTLGYDWVYSDVRTGKYNGRSLTDPSVNYGQYVVNGYFCAWLGPNMGEGRIDFVNGSASYLSVLTSTYSGLCIGAYDSNGNLVATSGWAVGNVGTYSFTRLTVQAPNMAYVIIHDTGNYWIIDDLVTDAGGQHGLGPGPVYACIHVSADPAIVFETPGQSTNIVATVSDQLGNPISGVIVYFTSSLGILSSSSAHTDSQGKAAVTLSPSSSTMSPVVSTVSVEASGASANTIVIFCPPSEPATSWNTCPQFSIKSLSLSLSQYLWPCVQAYNLFHPFNPISVDSLNSLPPVSIYTIDPSPSANQATFARALSQFLGITAPSGYNPARVLILEFPFLQILNTLFGTNIQGPLSFPIPLMNGANLLFSAQNISTTPEGSFVLALTYSQVADSRKGVFDLLNAIASTLGTCLKMDAVDLIKNGADLFKGIVEIVGDVSVSVITSDMDQEGQLGSYTLLDVVHIADTFSTITTAGGIVKKSIHLLFHSTEAAASALIDVPDDVRTGFDALDLGLEILPYLPSLSFLNDNWLYQFFSTCVGVIVDFVDPNGTTVIPSVYNMGGQLVLGYNSSSSDIIYASPEGLLIPEAGEWLVLLNETQSMNYTVCLNAVGGNASVPYNLQILSSNQNVTAIGYAGMVLGGTSITIPVNVAPDGTLVQQVYLEPALSISETGNVYDFVATGLLSNGSLASVTNAFLTINGSQFAMTQDNSSTFEIQTPLNLPGNVSYLVYMISPNVPGGFASGILTQYNITFDQTGVGSDFTGTVVAIDGSNYDISTLPASFWWYNGSTHTFAFQSPLLVGSGAKEYDCASTTGLSTLQSDSITVSGAGNVTGNYVTRVHDVAVTNITIDRTWVYQGFSANMNVTILNEGDFDENVTVTLYYNITANKIIGAQNVPLSLGQNETVAFVWNTTGVPYCHNYTLTAVATIPADNNLTDNTLDDGAIKVRILGDIDGDGKVDILDAIQFGNYFGLQQGDTNWNADADVNRDGKTNILDIIIVAENFGKSGSS